MSTPAFSIRRTNESDWREIRAMRLQMIRDTPTAYTETLEHALEQGEAEWRMRGARGQGDDGILVVAIAASGVWVGTMGGFVPDLNTGPLLVGVYVAPAFRGRQVGVTDALLATVEEWARTHGGTLTLHVHEDNTRARLAYERRGFTTSGHSVPYDLDPAKRELEMVKQL